MVVPQSWTTSPTEAGYLEVQQQPITPWMVEKAKAAGEAETLMSVGPFFPIRQQRLTKYSVQITDF
jgi:hypothetical protein